MTRSDPTLRELAGEVHSGALDPVVMVARARARADETTGLNAFTWRAEQPGDPTGPLAGLPVAVKDNVDVAGMPTSLGRPITEASWPGRDAEIVAAIRRAGGTIVGKTNLPELASSAVTLNAHHGDVGNPWDERRVAGGSSGGAAVAVAVGAAAVSIATDTAGSAVIPAALTGTCGYRPTVGLVGTGGVAPLAPSLDTPGLVVPSAGDLRFVLEAIGLVAPSGPAVEPLRVGLPTGTDWFDDCEPGVAELVRGVVAAWADDGGPQVDVDLSLAGAGFARARAIYRREAARSFAQLTVEGLTYADTVRRRRDVVLDDVPDDGGWADQLASAFTEADVLVVPTVPRVAPEKAVVDESVVTDLVRHTYPFCGARLPLVSVDVGRVRGLPVGLLVVGPPGGDALAVAAAETIETAARRRTQHHEEESS
jgi:Asp-tRNA(Asn)/Glu-tRNA(Gln) amidotransferase A subunit family amidase